MKYEMMHPADQLVLMMNRVYYNGLTSTSGGNLSIIDENGDIWITPSGYDKGSLTRDDIMCVKKTGEIIGRHKPSMELPFHSSVYKMRPDIKTVFHAHPPALITFSVARIIPQVELIPEMKKLCGDIVLEPYAIPGSELLGKYISAEFKKGYKTVEMENHGVCIGTDSIFKAYRIFEALENFSHIQINAIKLGGVDASHTNDMSSEKYPFPKYDSFVPDTHTTEECAARRELVRFIRRSYNRKLFTSTQGTFSLRLSDGSFVITPEALDRDYMEEKDLVLVRDGKAESGKVPDRYAYIHEQIYKYNKDVNAVTTSLPQYIGAFTICNQTFDPRTIPESYLQLMDIKTVQRSDMYENPVAFAKTFSRRVPALVVKNEGLFTVGDTLVKAFDRMEVADFAADSLIDTSTLGKMVRISDEEVKEIDEAFGL